MLQLQALCGVKPLMFAHEGIKVMDYPGLGVTRLLAPLPGT